MAADLFVSPATLSRWGMPNEWHLSLQTKLPWLHLADGWKRMQSLYIFIEILKCQQNNNQAPTTNAFDTAFSSLLPMKEGTHLCKACHYSAWSRS